jgi:hypothetical protein
MTLETTWFGRLYRALLKPNPYQRLTWRRRALPDFLIIGAMRAGTTSLYHLLVQHPQVVRAVTKEVHFFDLNFGRGANWYRAHFRRKTSGPQPLTGESSPYYLFHPLAAARAASLLPDARLIVILRDPVRRAYSHYWHSRRYGFEERPFEQTIEKEPAELAGEVEKLKADPDYRSFAHQHHSYLARGRYAQQLADWFSHFPRPQFLVLEQKRFYADLQAGADALYAFLGLAPHTIEARRYNEARYPEMAGATLARLAEHFRPYNLQLGEMLGERFEWI